MEMEMEIGDVHGEMGCLCVCAPVVPLPYSFSHQSMHIQPTHTSPNKTNKHAHDNSGALARATDADFDAISILTNKKGGPLLAALGGGSSDASGRLVLLPARGRVLLPDLQVTDSSEALLSCRKPPLRLLVRAKHADGRGLSVRPAVSEGFVVTTRRTRNDMKADIPAVDDPIARISHMGKETVKKLLDLRAAARAAGTEVEVAECNSVRKVSDFQALARRADQDGHLRQKVSELVSVCTWCVWCV